MLETGVYHFSNADIFPTHIENLLHLSQRDIHEKEVELSKACYSMLLDLAPCIQQIHNTTPASENELVRKLIDYMEEEYARDVSLTELADYVNLSKEYMCGFESPSYFGKVFKKIAGCTPDNFRR